MLLLFDIDGTLLLRASAEHELALRRAAGEVHHLPVPAGTVETAGRTDRAIARALLEQAGVGASDVDRRERDWEEAACRAYAEVCPDDLRDKVAPGAVDVLTSLGAGGHRLALLTGNLEPIARLKLKRAGIGHFFERGQGGYGSDHEDRTALPSIARRRAGWPPHADTVVIGDTPLDVACARAGEVRCVGVTTGRYGAAELAGADEVISGLAELPAALARLA